jgi:hypothetical protein
LPEWIPDHRLATMSPPSRLRMVTGFPLRFWVEIMSRRSLYAALANV